MNWLAEERDKHNSYWLKNKSWCNKNINYKERELKRVQVKRNCKNKRMKPKKSNKLINLPGNNGMKIKWFGRELRKERDNQNFSIFQNLRTKNNLNILLVLKHRKEKIIMIADNLMTKNNLFQLNMDIKNIVFSSNN